MRLFLIIFLLSTVNAEISNDSLAVLIEKGKIQILDEVKYNDPLKDKIGGIEINPLYSMIYSDDKFSFSGTVSFFPKDQKAEIAFPFSKKTRTDDFFQIDNGEATTLNIDAQYRYFLGEYRKGIYIMGGLRYSNHEEQNSFTDLQYNKSGVSFGVGYRIFGTKGLYWGCSLYYGKYYFGSDDGPGSFMNLEFFKFGKTF